MTAFRILKVKVTASTNIKFSGCTFQHLGGVYALGADQGSQSIVVVNSTFTDVSGGGVRAQKSFPFPNPQNLFFFIKKKRKRISNIISLLNLRLHLFVVSSSLALPKRSSLGLLAKEVRLHQRSRRHRPIKIEAFTLQTIFSLASPQSILEQILSLRATLPTLRWFTTPFTTRVGPPLCCYYNPRRYTYTYIPPEVLCVCVCM